MGGYGGGEGEGGGRGRDCGGGVGGTGGFEGDGGLVLGCVGSAARDGDRFVCVEVEDVREAGRLV